MKTSSADTGAQASMPASFLSFAQAWMPALRMQNFRPTLLLTAFVVVAANGAEDPTHKQHASTPGLTRIQLVCVDERATGYGTFQSHNQKVVSNAKGIFMTHIRTRNEPYTAQAWRLSWSPNGGGAFTTLYEATNATSAPVLETDAQDNLYLIRPDFVDGDAYLYRFFATNGYRRPFLTRITNGAAGKYSMILDRDRQQLGYFAHNNTFHQIGIDGAVRTSIQLLKAGKSAALQYPLLCLDQNQILHAAWTTQAHGPYLYWDIHYMQSPDGGATWRKMDGANLSLPVIADQTGPADRITLDDEFEIHTWLSSFLVKDGKAHFLYLAQTNPARQHYVRYDLKSARRDRDIQPEFKGDRISLRNLDGFFAARGAAPGSTLYCIAQEAKERRIACLASDDNGATWYDYAVSDVVQSPYAIGGCRELTGDGFIIGSFTDQVGSTPEPGASPKVYFLKIQAGLSSVRVDSMSAVRGVAQLKFSGMRGQPAQIRFGNEGLSWGPWQTFAPELTVLLNKRPTSFQLRSRLGVESEIQSLAWKN